MTDEMLFGPQPQYKQSEKKRAQVRERVRRHRQRTKKDPAGKLATTWETNLAALEPVECQILLEKAKMVAELTVLLNERQPNPNHFRLVQQFIQESGGTTREWMPTGTASEPAFETSFARQDEHFRRFGLKTRVWQMFWTEYLKGILMQAGVIGLKPKETILVEPSLLAEIREEYDKYEREREARDAHWPKPVWNPVTKLYEPENGMVVEFHGKTDE